MRAYLYSADTRGDSLIISTGKYSLPNLFHVWEILKFYVMLTVHHDIFV